MTRKQAPGKCRALYIRVSTDAQAEEGYSIQAQQEKLEAYCKAMSWDDFEVYKDPGFSGSNLNRPDITRLISDAKAGKLKSVIVYKLDRLSRSQKDTLYLIEDVLMPNGVDFISLNESIDTSTPYGRAMIGILSAFAQLERENIYMRTRMGMLERVKQGYWMGGGGTPFGYDYDREKGILVPNEDAETVRRIYDLYIKGYSAQRIGDLLGIKSEKLIMDVVARKSNLGVISYNGEVYNGLHEAIVSEEVYELAMQKMKERGTKTRATTNHFLLTGLVYCGDCGARMRYIRWGKGGYKLRCYSRDKSKPHMCKDANCKSEPVWADKVEELVLKDLFQISANMEAGIHDGDYKYVDPVEETSTRIRQVESKIKRLYNLYAEGGDDMLLETIEENKQCLTMLNEALEEEKSKRSKTSRLEGVRLHVSSIAQSWPLLTDMERQTLIRDCVEKIVISGNRIEIFYTFIKAEAKTAVA